MKRNELGLTTKALARITGAFYLIIIVAGLLSGLFVREALIDPTNATTTLKNIIIHETLFRLGFLGDLTMVLSDAVVSVLFYFLLKKVHAGLAVFAAVFRLLQSAVLGVNLIHLFKPVLMIQGVGEMTSNQLSNLGNEVLFQMQVFENGYLISGVFFAINCLLMGVLLYKSVEFPNALGVMLFVAGLGYGFNCMANFIIPYWVEFSELMMLLTAVVAELSFCIYLLVKGSKNEKQMV